MRDFVQDVAGMVSDYAHGMADYLEQEIKIGAWKDPLTMNLRTAGYATGIMSYGLGIRDVIASERRDVALAEFAGGIAGGKLGGSLGFAIAGPPGMVAGGALGGADGNVVFGTGMANGYRFADVGFAVAGRTAVAPRTMPLDDTYIGTSGHDTINAGVGNDAIYGGAGNDSLIGGSGTDVLNGLSGNDVLYGGHEADRFVLTPSGGIDRIAHSSRLRTRWICAATTSPPDHAAGDGNRWPGRTARRPARPCPRGHRQFRSPE